MADGMDQSPSTSSASQNVPTTDAEEFITGFKDMNVFTQEALKSLLMAVKSSNDLPNSGDDFDYYSSFPAYREIMDIEGKRILDMIHDIMRHCGVKGNLSDTSRALELEDKFDVLTDANDQLLERAGSLLDEVEGLKKKETALVIASVTPKNSYTASWNKKTPGSDSKPANYKLLTARNIQRPQLRFRDKVDNSKRPFTPKIRNKPNALKQLQDCFIIQEESENIISSENQDFHFPHPYQFELDHFTPLPGQLQKNEPKRPDTLDATPLTFVKTADQVSDLLKLLKSETEIAVDLEHHSYRTFQGITCLMQISTRKQDFLVDTLELRDELGVLNEVFTDPNIVKVLHGADSDIEWLQRDLGLYVVNMFDTGQAARVMNMARFSLAYLLMQYCQVEADKQYQLADWRIRPLPQELLKYAREDTHYLLYIYDCMKNELIERGNDQTNLLVSVYQRSKQICLKTYRKPVFLEDSYMELYRKRNKVFNSRQMAALRELFRWRDGMARLEDESLGFVLPNHMLMQIAEFLPREMQGILACCNPIPPLVHQNLTDLHRIVLQARELPLEKVKAEKQLGPSKQQHPKYHANSLLHCVHDFSHRSSTAANEHQADSSSSAGTSLVSENKGKLESARSKKSPSISFLFTTEVESATSQMTKAQKIAAKIMANFISPFEKYLPIPAEKLIHDKYVKPLQTSDSRSDVAATDGSAVNKQWKLVTNTKLPSEPAEPVFVQKNIVPSETVIALTSTEPEENEEIQPIRQKKVSKRPRPDENGSSSSKTQKIEKPPPNPDLKSFDYGEAASRLFDEVLEERKKERRSDSGSSKSERRHQGPSKSKQFQKYGKKSMTSSKPGRDGHRQTGAQQYWPKR